MASTTDFSSILDVIKTHRAASIIALGAAIAIPLAIKDYRTYLSYGPGGLPYNAAGWLIANIARLISREPLSTSVYNNPSLPFANEPGYLPADFPHRRNSERPRLGPHPIPQRQLDQLPSNDICAKLVTCFTQLSDQAQAKGLTVYEQSKYELRHKAIFVSRSRDWHEMAQQTNGEISHVHQGLDNSIHVVLHPADAKAVIDAGWGQRHGLSGLNLSKRVRLPITYVLIYAPRNETDVAVAMTIVKASIRFMTGSREQLE
ncbi:hypothetical protein BDV96DRAFT_645032 [Lophiotrema nucula]|uniref:Luciferase domain-containing protein n=1 Tax=Lophiotrema nucula TaxID=690887 RepID=A0A6A5ZCX7_9PLEO|nr:hypothetical protein BDV96DRAFT_645032 [Lophiotrema nucula]